MAKDKGKDKDKKKKDKKKKDKQRVNYNDLLLSLKKPQGNLPCLGAFYFSS